MLHEKMTDKKNLTLNQTYISKSLDKEHIGSLNLALWSLNKQKYAYKELESYIYVISNNKLHLCTLL